jgi:ATP-dependent exoDNAse (exonuclease V) beta subunit
VVSAVEPSFVVRASAGTGKTTTLVARYLRHVTEDGLRPDQILTVTFTRKAAAEMKGRIVDALTLRGLREEAQIAETGPIQTLHGFCERILRECSVDAGLDPDFTILSETEASRRMRAAIQEAIASIEAMPAAEALLQHLAGKRGYQGASPHAMLEGAVAQAVGSLRGTLASRNELEDRYRDPSAVLDYWREAILEETVLPVRAAMAGQDPSLPFGVRLHQSYKEAKLKPPTPLPTVGASDQAARLERDGAIHACGLMQLACRTWRSFEEANGAEHALDFVELERATVDLLRHSEAASRRLRAQFKSILVDEAQDLNPIQHQLIEALAIDNEMFVGDAQQSIYGFRQADVRLFEAKANRVPALQLSSNKRSEQGILRFVDELFGSIWKDQYVPMAAPFDGSAQRFEGVELWVQKARDTAQIAAWVEELAADEGCRNVAVLVRTGGYAQELLGRLEVRGVPARIIGGSERYYTRLEVRDLANVLKAMVDPYDDFSLLCALHSPIAGISMDSIVQLASARPVWPRLAEFEPLNPEDNARLAAFMGWFEPLSAYADRISAWEALGEVLAQSPYLQTLAQRHGGLQTIANVRKLMSIAAQTPGAKAVEFANRIREIREVRHHEGDAPAIEDESNQVSIMTIHKAKGLEFPVVVVPETLSSERPAGAVEVDRYSGMLTVKFGEGSSAYHALNVQARKERDREELRRLLYVACTRARRRLCLVVDPSAPPAKLAGEIIEHLGWREAFPPDVKVREARASSGAETVTA